MTTQTTTDLIARIQADPELAAHLATCVEAWDAERSADDDFGARLARLGLDPSDERRADLKAAARAGVDDETLRRLAEARELSRSEQIDLPMRYGHTSRADGWARLGRGDDAHWGEVVGSRVRVDEPGEWLVYSSDGFSRQAERRWTVEHIDVGDMVWTIAD